MAEWAVFERLVSVVDLWLYDFKETDPQLHAKFTGFGNSPILANLRSLHRAAAKILLRCPMIPQHNARQAHLDGIAALAQELPKLAGVELLPYYDLWRAKLKRFGLPSTLPESVKPPDRATMNSWIDYLRQRGVRVAS
jgi:pyruvate formate lyase activating enzyme